MAIITAADRQRYRIEAKEKAEAALGRPVSNEEAADWVREQKKAQRAPIGHRPAKPAAEMEQALGPIAHLVPDQVIEFTEDELTPVGEFLCKMVAVQATRSYVNVSIQCNPAYHHLLTDILALSGHPVLMKAYEVLADLERESDAS